MEEKGLMTFEEYQQLSGSTAVYPNRGQNIVYPTLGLAGEAGEVAEKIKKIFRDDNGEVTEEKRQALIGELGDVLWYVSNLASELNISLDAVARLNIKKLLDRKQRGVLQGSGDNR